MNNQKLNRTLIVSNDCLSKSNSNGRTLMNFLVDYPSKKLAQFYLHGTPDFSACEHYYRVTDHEALHAFLSLQRPNKSGEIFETDKADAAATNIGKSMKPISINCRTRFLRDVVWSSMRWWNNEFDAFLQNFQPQVVLLQAGDCPFMYKIAMKIAKQYSARLVMFNTENYVLKDVMYSKASKKDIFHNLLQKRLKNQYAAFMKRVDYCIYNTEYIEHCYQEKYPHPNKSTALYTSTDMEDCSQFAENPNVFKLLYCGNLGVGRIDPLCTMAKTLSKVNPNAKLQICGKFVSAEDEQKLCAYNNVEYLGFVSYSEIPWLYGQASVLIHCENNNRLKNLETAFSTKIADLLASGIPFLVYASGEYPFVQYLQKHQAAHIAQNEEELYTVLHNCNESDEYRTQYIERAKQLVNTNHNTAANAQKFKEILNA